MEGDPVARCLLRLSPVARVVIVVSGAVLIHLSLGTYHTFGNMLPYMASYMRNYTDPSITVEQLVWIPTFQGCFPFAMVVGGCLSARLGPRIAAFIGCSIMATGVFLTYWTIQKSMILFLVTYGMMFGFGQGMAYVIAVSSAINWAPEHVGLVSGIVAAGFGISSSILTPIQTLLVNPWNYKPTTDGYFLEKELMERVPGVFSSLAFIYAIMQLCGLIFICDPPDVHRQKVALAEQLAVSEDAWWNVLGKLSKWSHGDHYAYKKLPLVIADACRPDYINKTVLQSPSKRSFGEDEEGDDDSSSTEENSTTAVDRSLTTSEMLQSSTFYWLFIALFCCSFYGNMFYNLYKTYGETFIDDDMFMAFAFSVASILNAFARIGWGLLTDKLSFQTSLSCATMLATLLLLTMPLTPRGGKWLYFIWMNLMFVCLAATHALFITASVKCFGSRHKATNYGCLILSTTLSATVLAFGCEYVLTSIGYEWSMTITAAFPFTAFIITTFIQHTPQGHRIT